MKKFINNYFKPLITKLIQNGAHLQFLTNKKMKFCSKKDFKFYISFSVNSKIQILIKSHTIFNPLIDLIDSNIDKQTLIFVNIRDDVDRLYDVIMQYRDNNNKTEWEIEKLSGRYKVQFYSSAAQCCNIFVANWLSQYRSHSRSCLIFLSFSI